MRPGRPAPRAAAGPRAPSPGPRSPRRRDARSSASSPASVSAASRAACSSAALAAAAAWPSSAIACSSSRVPRATSRSRSSSSTPSRSRSDAARLATRSAAPRSAYAASDDALALAREPGELLLRRAALGRRGLDGPLQDLGALGDLAQARRQALARAAGRGDLGRQQVEAQAVGLLAQQRGALGGGGLQLQRAQPRRQLALQVAGARQGVLDAAHLAQRPVPPALVLAEPGGLLDQPAPVGGPREQDLLDLALPDHRVQLAPQPRVGQRLLHVQAPYRHPVEQVVRAALAGQPAHHRDLGAAAAEACRPRCPARARPRTGPRAGA